MAERHANTGFVQFGSKKIRGLFHDHILQKSMSGILGKKERKKKQTKKQTKNKEDPVFQSFEEMQV